MRSVLVLLLGFILVAGCQERKTRAVEGGVAGGIIGAGLGSIIGHQSGETGEGAAIGGAVGAIAGSVIGAQMNRSQESGAVETASPQSVSPNQMSLDEVVALSRQGVDERVIIDRIKITGSRFTLTAAQVDSLKNEGVSDAVIAAMQGY